MSLWQRKPAARNGIQTSDMDRDMDRKPHRLWCMWGLTVVGALAAPLAAQTSQPEALAVVRSAVAAEMHANDTDKSNWMYRDEDDEGGRRSTYNAIETPQGELRRLIALNGKPLSPAADQEEQERIRHYLRDSSEQAHNRKGAAHDDAQAAELLNMLPEAFVWSIAGQDAENITLDFRPNPAFNPPDTQSRVLGAMGGQMVVDRKGQRIRTLRGKLLKEIVFGLAFFGKLDQGGTFDVERRMVGSGHWQITETHVHIGGHALFFKSIGSQQDEVKTNWHLSTDATLAAAAHTLGVQ
jgi:hypothetical protein